MVFVLLTIALLSATKAGTTQLPMWQAHLKKPMAPAEAAAELWEYSGWLRFALLVIAGYD